MDNGKFVQAIQPAAWARQLAPDDYSIKVHLEITMLLALGILDEKPAWMGEHPVIRPDGIAWSRYWWPRPLEERELLPAARLPAHILARMLPPNGPNMEVGDLADTLYERAGQYADDTFISQIHQAVTAEQHVAEVLHHNAMNRARQRAMLGEVREKNPKPIVLQPPAVDSPAMPEMPFHPQIRPTTPSFGHGGIAVHDPAGIAGFPSTAAAIPNMPIPPTTQLMETTRSPLPLATRRPPSPPGAATRLGSRPQ